MFHTNRGRNLVAILAILLTTMMFATLFTLTQSMSRNLVEMTFRQTGYNAQASMRGLTEEQADLIADHPDVAELGRSIVLGLTEYFGLPFLEPTTPRPAVVDVSWGSLNIRARPDRSAPILARAYDGARLTIINQWQGWYLVRFGDVTGYASGDYITLL